MNKVIIHNIISQNQKQLQGKDGGTYFMFSWKCSGLINNQPIQQFTINAFAKKDRPDLNLNTEYEMEQQSDRNTGAIWYKFTPQKKQYSKSYGGGTKQVTYTLDEYDKLFDHAVLKATGQATKASKVQEDFANIFSSILGTYFIGATKAGVKITTPVQKVEQAFNGQQVQQQTMLDQSPIIDDNVPF